VQALKALWPRQKDQGSLAQRHYDALDVDGDADGIQVYAVRSIAQIMCRIVTGREVQAERDGNNAGSEDEAPPVLPADVVKPRPAIIVKDVLQLYASTTRFWSDEAIYEIEQQHRSLRDAYSKEDA
jgi:hypothetical protein